VLRLLLPRLPLRWAHPLGTFSATLVVLNALGWFMLGVTPEKTVPLAFAVFGTGALIFTTRSLLFVIGIAASGWFWFAWQGGFQPGLVLFWGRSGRRLPALGDVSASASAGLQTNASHGFRATRSSD
jgi:uncharacterized membrane protein YuzA (DUF378 family)